MASLAENSGADDYLCKPLTPQNFLPKVKKMLAVDV
jgi:DNA-binding response OmpR family regulator